MKPATMVVATDRGSVTWTPRTEPQRRGHDYTDLVCDGFLFGPSALTDRVRAVLADPDTESVEVLHGQWYEFTEGRDTLGDLAAAMIAAGGPRGYPSDSVRAALAE